MTDLITYEELKVTDSLIERCRHSNGKVIMGIVHYKGQTMIKAVKTGEQWGRMEYSSFIPFSHAIAVYFKGKESMVKFYVS